MSGDDTFYRQFLAPLEARLLRTVSRVLRDPDAARDALQDALLRVWQHRDEVRAHPNPEALIVRIGYHAAIDAVRRERRRPLAADAGPDRHPDTPSRSPLAVLERTELLRAVLDAIGRLPRTQAVAVLMRVVEEEPYSSVAQVLGCAEITARIHVMRGRAKLCRLLGQLAPRSAPEEPAR